MMAVKKSGNNLRSKIRSKSNALNVQRQKGILKGTTLESKVKLKIDSRLAKSQTFADAVRSKYGKINNIEDSKHSLSTEDPSYKNFEDLSKSAIRRRKRKLRDQLKPQLEDMMSELDNIANDTTEGVMNNKTENGYIGTKNNHTPNPHKSSKGKVLVEKLERTNFNGTLANEGFRQNPFGTLRSKIANNLNRLQ